MIKVLMTLPVKIGFDGMSKQVLLPVVRRRAIGFLEINHIGF